MSEQHPIITRMRDLDRAVSECDRLGDQLKAAESKLRQAKDDLHQTLQEDCDPAMVELIRGQRIELTDCTLLVDDELGYSIERRLQTLPVFTLQMRYEERQADTAAEEAFAPATPQPMNRQVISG